MMKNTQMVYIRHTTWTLIACVVQRSASSRHGLHSHSLHRTNSARRLCTPNYNRQVRSQCMHSAYILHAMHGCILASFKALHTSYPPYLADLLQYHKRTRSTHSSASHSSMAQPVIWFSCFLYLCTKNMELLTSSHYAVSNTLFI